MGPDGNGSETGITPPQEVVQTEQTPPKSGVESYVASLVRPTPEQRSMLAQYKDQGGELTPEIRAALAAEREERIGENLPSVVDHIQKRFADHLANLRSQAETAPRHNHDYYQHKIKVAKDVQTLLTFKSSNENVTDQKAQQAALMAVFALMYNSSYTYGADGVEREEESIRTSGDPSTAEAQQKLKGLAELKSRARGLKSDLYEKYNYHPWFNLKAHARVLDHHVINDYRDEESSTLDENIATNVDPEYYKAWFGEFGRDDYSRSAHPELKQKITSKWESSKAPPPNPIPTAV